MSALTDRIDSKCPTAERLIDGGDHRVLLNLEPIAAGLINDIAMALRTRGHLFTVLANNKVGTPEHTAVRRQILELLSMSGRHPLQVVLGALQADELACDLFAAAAEPPFCEGACGGENYAVRADGLCEPDGEAADLREADVAQIRSVS